jgi:colicin import membrane protein
MKKSSIYFLAPVIGLIIFGAVYWNFSSGFEAKEAQKALVLKQAREATLLAQAKANEAAIKEANAGVERRKAERAAKDAKEKQDKDARQAQEDARSKAFNDADKFSKQVTRLEAEVKAEQEAIAKLQDDKKKLADEEVFLRGYTQLANDNVKSLQVVLDRIAAADAARAAAEAAAASAAAAKKNS